MTWTLTPDAWRTSDAHHGQGKAAAVTAEDPAQSPHGRPGRQDRRCAPSLAKVTSERLGHHSTAFMLDVYSHVVPGMQQDAAERVAGLILDDPTDDSTRS